MVWMRKLPWGLEYYDDIASHFVFSLENAVALIINPVVILIQVNGLSAPLGRRLSKPNQGFGKIQSSNIEKQVVLEETE